MQFFTSKRATVLGLALTLAVSGAHSALAQDATQTDPAAAPVTEVPAEPAAPVVAEPAPARPTATPAAPALAQLNPIGTPPEGMAQIVFFRPSRFVGAAVSFSVREGDKGIGKLTNGTYFVHTTEPGTKEYNISFEAKDTLRLEIDEGETYYVVQAVAMGVIAARPNLTPSSEQAFQEKKLKVTKAKATDRK